MEQTSDDMPASADFDRTSCLSDAALVAAYLRRLGFQAAEAANFAQSQPLAAGATAPQVFLSDLVHRHVLNIPFDTSQQSGARICPRDVVRRIAFGAGGGHCFDLNPALSWVLQQLGATARLGLACQASADGFVSEANLCIILVDFPDETMLVDPGFEDPPRSPVALQGITDDEIALFDISESIGAPNGFTKTLHKQLCKGSSSRHLWDPDNAALDHCEAEKFAVYAFRPADDLKYDSAELCAAVRRACSNDSGVLSQSNLISLALPRGHVTLSQNRLRRVERGTVVKETVVNEDNLWSKLAGEILEFPLLSPLKADSKWRPRRATMPTPNQSSAPPSWVKRPTESLAQIARAQASRELTSSKGQNLGLVDQGSLAVGGAGSGGGLGLNAPGFGPKVKHFTVTATKSSSAINVSPDIMNSWAQVVDDKDPLAWICCQYSSDFKSLDLTSTGEDGLAGFKGALGDTIAWGGFRCYGVDKRGGLECKRPKFIFVQYKPAQESAMKKAKQGSHKSDVKAAITGTHLDVSVETLDDLDEQVLITKLQGACGAHKPNGYEFEAGVFLEADYYGLGIGQDCRGETAIGRPFG